MTAGATGNARPSAVSHLDRLEAEAIHILREAIAEARNPAMLFSTGAAPTLLARAEVLSCVRCNWRLERPVGGRNADREHCGECNP